MSRVKTIGLRAPNQESRSIYYAQPMPEHRKLVFPVKHVVSVTILPTAGFDPAIPAVCSVRPTNGCANPATTELDYLRKSCFFSIEISPRGAGV